MTVARRLAVAACATATGLNAACYAYQPLAGAPPVPGRQVRVELTADGTTELARYLGPGVATVEGRIASLRGDGATNLAVEWVQLSNGTRQPWSGEGLVAIPAPYVREVRQHALQRGRTTAAAIALVAGLAAVAAIALSAGGANTDGDGGGGGPPP